MVSKDQANYDIHSVGYLNCCGRRWPEIYKHYFSIESKMSAYLIHTENKNVIPKMTYTQWRKLNKKILWIFSNWMGKANLR